MPVRFQITSASQPSDLDERLAARGYVIDAPVDYLVATAKDFLAEAGAASEVSVDLVEEVDDDWIDGYGNATDATRRRIHAYRELMHDIGPATLTAVADVGGSPAGIGFAVVERGWVGVYGMATASSARRMGVARAVLLALLGSTAGRAERAYLQVETDNVAARGLYRSLGFEPVHRYHFRVLDASA
jgi:ribosomal protein S18 acetylase RimI-like enzyme